MKRTLTVLALSVLLSCAFVGMASAKTDPRQCPRDIAKAIDNADLATFEKLVDLDAIIDEGVTLFIAEMGKPENARQLPPMLAMMFSRAAGQDDMGKSIRTMLAGESRAFICNGVSSGAFAGRKPNGATQQGLLAPLFENASQGRKEIRSIGQATPIGNAMWHVPFVIHDGGNGLDYPIVGLVSQASSGLRLVAIDNFADLFARVAAESRNIQ